MMIRYDYKEREFDDRNLRTYTCSRSWQRTKALEGHKAGNNV
jgi:hypothetical protein